MTYRDDHDALRSYHGHLVDELARLEAKASELAGVAADRDRIAAELVRVRADLDQQRARRSPIRLDNLRVASPCKESWAKMTGDERVRACARCEKQVFNLSQMTRAEAEDLLATRGITACVRFYRRADGTVMTEDCPVGARGVRRNVAIAAGVIAVTAGSAGLAAMMTHETPSRMPLQGAVSIHDVEPEMGKMAMPDLPPPPLDHLEPIQGGIGPALDVPVSPDPLPKSPHHTKKPAKQHK